MDKHRNFEVADELAEEKITTLSILRFQGHFLMAHLSLFPLGNKC